MFVYPANQDADLPELFSEFGQVPEMPITIDPAEIEKNRETWIQAWTDLMLR